MTKTQREYEVTGEGRAWYVMALPSRDFVAGPFPSKRQAVIALERR